MTLATTGLGSKVRRLNGSVYEDIAEIVSIDGPSKSRETVDATNMDSAGGYREFLASLRDPGGVTFEMNFTRDGYEAVNTDFESDDSNSYQILLPDAENTSLSFTAWITELPISVPLDDVIRCSVTMKITGQITIDSGSS